jgi:hypothetical protein
MFRTQHYWAIHRKIAFREWGNLDDRRRDIISADTNHESHELKEFNGFVHNETLRLYEDPGYYYNQPYTFKAQY